VVPVPDLDRFNDNAFRYIYRPEKQQRCIVCSRDIKDGELCEGCEDELLIEKEKVERREDYWSVFVGFPLLGLSWFYFIWVVYG
jgi:predicted nucleic acid-binding Zn ribbon protein